MSNGWAIALAMVLDIENYKEILRKNLPEDYVNEDRKDSI